MADPKITTVGGVLPPQEPVTNPRIVTTGAQPVTSPVTNPKVVSSSTFQAPPIVPPVQEVQSVALVFEQPILSSISLDLGDPLGGELRALAGLHLSSTGSVMIGGQPATILSTSDAEVDILTPALAPGAPYDIVLTTKGGTAKLISAYEAWAPYVDSGRVLDATSGTTQVDPTDLTTWGNVGGLTCVGGQADPLGGSTAFKLVEPNALNGFEHFWNLTPRSPAHAVTTATIWAKANGRNWFWIELTNGPDDFLYVNFDLQNGVLGNIVGNGVAGAIVTGKITAKGGGWYECSITVTNYASSEIFAVDMGPEIVQDGFFYQGDGVSGTFLWNPTFTNMNKVLSQWNDRSTSHKDVTGTVPSIHQTAIIPGHFGPDAAPRPGIIGDGESAGAAHGPRMNLSVRELLSTGKSFFWVAKTKDARDVAGTNGNVPNQVIGDAANGWFGNAGYVRLGKLGMVNWTDDLAHAEVLTFGNPINDGQPHRCMITHSHLTPWPVEGYVDGVRQTTGTRTQVGQAEAAPTATPLFSNYNAAQIGWSGILSGFSGNDDFFNGNLACVVVYPTVVTPTIVTKTDKWGYGRFIHKSLAWKTRIDPVPWSSRDGARLVYLNASLLLIAGWDPTSRNDIWRCDNPDDAAPLFIRIRDDNQSPSQTGPDAMFTPRHKQPVFVHHARDGFDYIYVVGGDNTDGGYPNGPPDVWRTKAGPDCGKKWERVAFNCPWGQRTLHMAESLNGVIYLFGGQTNPSSAATALKDVWQSVDDGFTWTRLADAPWAARGIGAVGIFNGLLWMICGGTNDSVNANTVYYNDVWCFDGRTWFQVLANGHALFLPRKYTEMFVKDGLMYFGSGVNVLMVDTFGGNVSDLFKSPDGRHWTEHTFPIWGQRHADTWAAGPRNAYHCCGRAGGNGDTQLHRFEQL